jgi:sec-independent protein translocase protein TatA
MIGSQSMLLVLGVVLLLFGGKKLPELAGALGKSMKELKKSVEGGTSDDEPQPSAAEASRAASATVESRVCSGCATALKPEWSHCPHCGLVVPSAAAASPDAKR